MSITTTSGRSAQRRSSTRLGAVGRLPTTSMSVLGARASRGSPPRIERWSSASSDADHCRRPCDRQAGAHGEAAAARAPGVEVAAVEAHPLAHARPGRGRRRGALARRRGRRRRRTSTSSAPCARSARAPAWARRRRAGARSSAPPARCGRRPGRRPRAAAAASPSPTSSTGTPVARHVVDQPLEARRARAAARRRPRPPRGARPAGGASRSAPPRAVRRTAPMCSRARAGSRSRAPRRPRPGRR